MRLRALALAFLFSVTAFAEDDFAAKRAKAIEKGIAWLEKAQHEDGSWTYEMKPFTIGIQMKQGCTAFAALALLKSGVRPDAACIEKAFESMANEKLDHVYSAGCVLLAIEARYNWEPPPLDEPGEGTREKKRIVKPLKASPRDLELAEKCREFLVKVQEPNGAWSYPIKGTKPNERADSSHPQYALLGLDAAERLGLKVPRDVWLRAAEYFVANQEKEGPEVPSFPVPGADLSWKELQKIEKEMREKIQKVESEFRGKKAGDTNSAGRTEEDERRTVERDAAGKLRTTSKAKMFARGWQYAYPPAQLAPWKTVVSGSMTVSGLASLFTCKAHLDGGPDYEKARPLVDKALRDGAAWVAQHYTVMDNPPRNGLNHYYFMYGLERAGILGLIPAFGTHDWYDDGCKMFLDQQKTDGSWDAGMQKGTNGPVPDTAFALLYLCRGTTPLVRIPTRTATGPGK